MDQASHDSKWDFWPEMKEERKDLRSGLAFSALFTGRHFCGVEFLWRLALNAHLCLTVHGNPQPRITPSTLSRAICLRPWNLVHDFLDESTARAAASKASLWKATGLNGRSSVRSHKPSSWRWPPLTILSHTIFSPCLSKPPSTPSLVISSRRAR
jgi:hypothetical protein